MRVADADAHAGVDGAAFLPAFSLPMVVDSSLLQSAPVV